MISPLFRKLNFKDHKLVLVLNEPCWFDLELALLPEATRVFNDPESVAGVDFVVAFVLSKEQIKSSISRVFPNLIGDACLWFCYPKGTSKNFTCDFNRDNGWEEVGHYNLEAVRQVSLDNDWSALRFRKVQYIKKLTREANSIISEEGRNKAKN